MKKDGKKYRKIQRERAERRNSVKQGEPFSKVRQKELICWHYDQKTLLKQRPNVAFSSPTAKPSYALDGPLGPCIYLLPISENECYCLNCKKRFPIHIIEDVKKLRLMEWYESMSYIGLPTENGFEKYGKEELEAIRKKVLPVHYHRISESEVEYIEA